VDSRLIVDPKVVLAFTDSHVAQMLGYLNITRLRTALLLNFKNAKLGIKRVSLTAMSGRPDFTESDPDKSAVSA
jgi:hypothetical protein